MKKIGIVITGALAVIILFQLFKPMITHPNDYFFSIKGDGIQHYYSFLYHVKHDTVSSHTIAMNYPYGELNMYVGNIPVISNPLKLLSELYPNLANHSIAIYNYIILSSAILAAIFIFLIFFGLRINFVSSILFAIGVTFLSPQLFRLGGHLSLAFICAIPMLIYFLKRWHKNRTYLFSVLIAFTIFFFSKVHGYFLFIYSLMLVIYWFFEFINKDKVMPTWSLILHFLIQLIIPTIIVVLSVVLFDVAQERPTKPYGFLIYRAYPEGVLLPIFEPYGNWIKKIINVKYVNWEGVAYVGLVASISFFIIIYNIIKSIIQKRCNKVFEITDNSFVNRLLWIGIVGLLYSFGIPYILGLEFLIDYIGPLRQIRGIGRFAWIFFYVINIVGIYYVWDFLKTKENKILISGIIVLTAILWYDAWLNIRSLPDKFQKTFPQLTEKNEKYNSWLESIETDDYQAILPLPLYQQGPENIGKSSICDIKPNSFVASLKTSLPLAAISASRTSLEQAIKNIQLVQEPYRSYPILDDLPNSKPFLLVVDKCFELTEFEMNLVNNSEIIDSSFCCKYYKLSINTLETLPKNEFQKNLQSIHTDNLLNLDSADRLNVIYLDYDTSGSKISYMGEGALLKTFNKETTIYNEFLHFSDTSLILNFWYSPINKDLYPRLRLQASLIDSANNKYWVKEDPLLRFIKIIDGPWALIEINFDTKDIGDRLIVRIKNNKLANPTIGIDELLIRPVHKAIMKEYKTHIMINNRFYSKSYLDSTQWVTNN